MVLLFEGLNRIRDLVDADITRGQLGTDSTTPAETQTALIAPVAATLQTTTSTTVDATATSTGSLLVENFTQPSTAGTGSTYYEFGLRSAAAANVDYSRIVINPGSGYAHTSTKELKVISRLFFKNG